MNRVTRRAVAISRRASEYYVAKRGFRVEQESKESKDDDKK